MARSYQSDLYKVKYARSGREIIVRVKGKKEREKAWSNFILGMKNGVIEGFEHLSPKEARPYYPQFRTENQRYVNA